MQALAGGIDAALNGKKRRRWGFALLVFPLFDIPDNQRGGNYVSNSKREDMIAAMKEWIARQEGHYHETGGNA